MIRLILLLRTDHERTCCALGCSDRQSLEIQGVQVNAVCGLDRCRTIGEAAPAEGGGGKGGGGGGGGEAISQFIYCCS